MNLVEEFASFLRAAFNWLTTNEHNFFSAFKDWGDVGNLILDSLKWTLTCLLYTLLSTIILCLSPIALFLSLITAGLSRLFNKKEMSEWALLISKISFDGIIIACLNIPTNAILSTLFIPFMILKLFTKTLGTIYESLFTEESSYISPQIY
ncbi:MAG: hypothetical protein LCH30_06325 [Proteobacteria bacterium]|nr:hypothetical protein [Pseudomonadota bacterium]